MNSKKLLLSIFLICLLVFSFEKTDAKIWCEADSVNTINPVFNNDSIKKSNLSRVIPYIGFSLITGSKAGILIRLSNSFLIEGIYGRLKDGIISPSPYFSIQKMGVAINWYRKREINNFVFNFTCIYTKEKVLYPFMDYLSKETLIFSPNIGYLPLKTKPGNKGFGIIIRGGIYCKFSKPKHLNNYSFAPINAPPFGYLAIAPNLDLSICYGF